MSARRDVAIVVEEHRLSERQACKLLEMDRSSFRYEPAPERGLLIKQEMLDLAGQKPR